MLTELRQSLEQQTATSEVLQTISGSPGDLEPVFSTMLEKAVRICDAKFGTLYLLEEAGLRLMAAHNMPEAFAKAHSSSAADFTSVGGALGGAMSTKRPVQITDLAATEAYKQRHPKLVEAVELGGIRTALAVPMLKDDVPIGVIALIRPEVAPFNDKQIALLASFAAQAVIAIENARLLNELRQSLEQQTATGEILSSMSGSIADTKPVFDAIIRNLLRLFGTRFAVIQLLQDGMIHMAAFAGEPGFERVADHFPRPLDDESFGGRAMLLKEAFQLAPLVGNPAVPLLGQRTAHGFGFDSIICTPMIRGDKVIGAIATGHREPKPFSEKQVALLKAFTDQAVIAIENARLLNELRQRTDDLSEALEQQTATSEVLQVISGSPGDLQLVFEAMLEKAVRICDAKFGSILRWDDEAAHLVATHNAPPAFTEARRHSLNPANPKTSFGRMVATKAVVHVADAAAAPGYVEARDPAAVAAVEIGGQRTPLYVPMLKETELVGALTLSRQEVRPFTDKQIDLVKNFAAQAVIAIENARLLNELRQRTDDLSKRTVDLTEALDQQTATSEVLQVIGGSPGDLQPVFETMLANATRICEAKFGVLWLSEGECFRCVALHNAPLSFADHYRDELLVNPPPGSGLRRLFETRQVAQVTDMTTIRPYIERDPFVVASVELGGYRSVLNVPMLNEGALVGAISIFRQEVRPFTDKQVALVTNFAAQAVIAIENARLLNELRQRTDDLTEALEQQTGTSELLQVISSSSGDLEPVFAAMLENAVRICGATFGNIYRVEGDGLRIVATHNTPPVFAEARRTTPYFSPGPKNPVRHMMTTKAVVHVDDVAATEAYADREPAAVASVELGGTRTLMIVPMLKENELVGACMLARQEIRPFNNKQIELVTNFAAQAVIAIENARLLNELRQRTSDLTERTADLTEALEQQTATSEVLQVISSSPGDLQPVFATMLEKAVRLCDANFGNIYRWDGELSNLLASHNTPPALVEARKRLRIHFVPKDLVGQAIANKKAVHIADLAEHQDYIERSSPGAVAAVELGGVRTHVVVPMLKDDELS